MSEEQVSRAVTRLDEKGIQRDAGSGSSEWADEDFDTESYYEDNGQSNAKTTFFHWDDSLPRGADREKWKRLSELNYGKRDDDNSHRAWKAGKVNDARLFCDHLDLDERKTELVIEMAEEIDFDKFGNYTTEQVIVAACSLVSDRDTTNFEDRIITRDEYKELMEVANMGSSEYRHIRQAIRERTEYF